MADTFGSKDSLVCIVVDCIAITLFVIAIVVSRYKSYRDSSIDWFFRAPLIILFLSIIAVIFILFLIMDISWYKCYIHQFDGDFDDLFYYLS